MKHEAAGGVQMQARNHTGLVVDNMRLVVACETVVDDMRLVVACE
jgi:hypothetical protein